MARRQTETETIEFPHEYVAFADARVAAIVRRSCYDQNIVESVSRSCYLQGLWDGLQLAPVREGDPHVKET
jgi:hypothetical protein